MSRAEFELFIEKYEKDIFSFCCYLTMDTRLAEELYQETVLHAFMSRGKLDISGNPVSYLLSIAVGKWKNSRRKASRRERIAPQVPLDTYRMEAQESQSSENPADVFIRS